MKTVSLQTIIKIKIKKGERCMNRTFEILNILLSTKEPVVINSIAKKLNVSNKTIRNNLNDIEEIVCNSGLKLIKTPGVGILLDGSDDIKLRFIDQIKDRIGKNVEPYSPEARKKYILKRLFMSYENITMQQVADELYVSRVTIYKDLEDVEKWLNDYNLKLLRKTNYGIEVVGQEESLRNAISGLIASDKGGDDTRDIIYSDYSGKIDQRTISKLRKLIDIDYAKIENIVNKAEDKLKFKFTDEAFISLVIHVAISIKRLKESKYINLPKEILNGLKENDEYYVAKEIAEDIDRAFNIDLPDSEIGYILLHILGTKMQQSNSDEIDLNFEKQSNSDLAVIISKEIIETSERALSMDLSHDKQFLNGLILHLRPTINRLKYGLTLRNPILNEIKEDYPDIYGVAWMTSVIFQKYLGVKIPEEEIGYLALHIGASVERNKSLVRALVVCTSGIGTSQLLVARLERCFKEIEIKDIIPSSRLKERSMNDIDIVISTIPIKADKPIINISPLLSQNDITRLEKLLNKVNEKKLSDSNILPFDDEFIYIDAEYNSRDALIKDVCNKLMLKGCIDSNYMNSVIEREDVGSTEIGNGVAIPHGYPDYVIKSKLVVILLKKPINWGNVKVDIVIMICISKNDFKILINQLRQIYKNFDSAEFLNKLRCLKNKKDIKKLLEEVYFVN